ncbi:MAG: AraC family transcriptional regulator, partial [Bacteroidota bacterium]
FIAFAFILILRVLFFILNPEWAEFGSKFWYYLCFSILFYYIAINGYSNFVNTLIPPNVSIFSNESVLVNKPLAVEAERDGAVKEHSSSQSEIADLSLWKEKLSELMLENRLYENPKLTLNEVSERMGIHPKLTSGIVNQGFDMNFNDFVNHYRVKAVIGKLESGAHHTTTLLGIALESGFNSKATFNRAFKKHTDHTPKRYVDKFLEN